MAGPGSTPGTGRTRTIHGSLFPGFGISRNLWRRRCSRMLRLILHAAFPRESLCPGNEKANVFAAGSNAAARSGQAPAPLRSGYAYGRSRLSRGINFRNGTLLDFYSPHGSESVNERFGACRRFHAHPAMRSLRAGRNGALRSRRALSRHPGERQWSFVCGRSPYMSRHTSGSGLAAGSTFVLTAGPILPKAAS